MQNRLLTVLAFCFLTGIFSGKTQVTAFRPPAIPLVINNPYFSIWSFTDHPAADWPRHWTGKVQAMCSYVKIDGQTYRLLGRSGHDVPAMDLKKTEIFPTKTVYTFEDKGIRITMCFLSPLLTDDLVLMSEPLTYISWKAEPLDGKKHYVSIYFDATAELAVNSYEQEITWSRFRLNDLDVMQIGSLEQPVLKKSGDDLRIDWGYLYLACPSGQEPESSLSGADRARSEFISSGRLPVDDDLRMPRKASDNWPVMAVSFNMSVTAPEERFILLAYDEQFRIEFLNRKLQPLWKNKGITTAQLLRDGISNYTVLRQKCHRFDSILMKELEKAGGTEYCHIATLAYRQALAAYGLAADIDGTPYYFPKENFSNGCISTVDVLYPACPILLYLSTDLLKASLEPVMIYAASSRWKFPFAPHDLGTYPLANGQVYGGGELSEEDQMPVEESGNMLIMLYALAKTEGRANFSQKYWPVVEKWALYLKDKGLDPENQLCTDDFAGHLAHNANLSAKAIIALGCYSRLCEMVGKTDESRSFLKLAKEYAVKWKEMAADGDHFRLAFDKPGTWSQKYNLVWDKILDLKLFDPEITSREITFYKAKQNKYGLPLDNRKDYTKLDWATWTAALSDRPGDFETFIKPVCKFLCETPDRIPMTDWYDTKTGNKVGFQARSVVGAVYIKMLLFPRFWEKPK